MRKQLFIAMLFWPMLMRGQDVHFSQFFAAPLLTNPAQTGNFDGSVRVGGNYRDQWGSVTVPYRTFSTYVDAAIQPKKSVNRFGIGLVALNDQAGDGLLTTNKVYLNTAYHIGYTEKDAVRFAVGLQGGFVQKSFDLSKLIFDSQWNDYTFDPNISNNETGLTEQLDYADVGEVHYSPLFRTKANDTPLVYLPHTSMSRPNLSSAVRTRWVFDIPPRQADSLQ